MRVRGVGPAGQHGVYIGVARQGVFLGFDDERAAALADNEPVAVEVERAAGMFRVVVTAGQRLGLRQAGHHNRTQDAFPTDREYRVRLAGAQQHGGGDDSVAARGAGGVERQARPADAMRNGDLRGGDVADGHRHEAGADAVARVERGLCLRDRGHAIHRRTHHDADAVGLARNRKPAVPERLLRGSESELHEGVHRARERLGHVVDGGETLQLGRDLHGQAGCVETGDRAYTAAAGLERLPVGGDPDADGRYRAHAGDYQCFFCHTHSSISIFS